MKPVSIVKLAMILITASYITTTVCIALSHIMLELKFGVEIAGYAAYIAAMLKLAKIGGKYEKDNSMMSKPSK